MQNQVRQKAKDLLEKGEIGYIIGWGIGRFAGQRPPVFIDDPAETDQLMWDEYCLATLAKYALDDPAPTKKIGICVRGCDARAVNRLLQDGQLKRENLYLIGLACEGKKEPATDELAEKCRFCTHPTPVVYDVLLGSASTPQPHPERFARVEEIEAMSAEERYAYFSKAYQRCIRCYACRNVCPACNCRECFVEQYRVGWQGKRQNLCENQFYGIIRAYHVGDRCIECGECERVCPMHLPLMELNRKLVKDAAVLFGDYEAGLDTETKPPLGDYRQDDPEEYM